MKWAVIILSVLTALFFGGAFLASNNERSAPENVAILVVMGVGLGAIDFVLIMIWLAIT